MAKVHARARDDRSLSQSESENDLPFAVHTTHVVRLVLLHTTSARKATTIPQGG